MSEERPSGFWDEVVRDYPAPLHSIQDVAAETGCKPDDIRSAYRRRGLRLTPDREKSIRNRALEMKPLDAVEYLLGVIEQVSWACPELPHETDCVDLALTPRKVLRALYDADGKTLSREALHNVICAGKSAGEIPGIKIIDIFVFKIRAALKGHPWRIVTIWGQGYRLEPLSEDNA